jgi:hypothetical protein
MSERFQTTAASKLEILSMRIGLAPRQPPHLDKIVGIKRCQLCEPQECIAAEVKS